MPQITPRHVSATAAGAVALAVLVAGCNGDAKHGRSGIAGNHSGANVAGNDAPSTRKVSVAKLAASVRLGAIVPVDTPVSVSVVDGTLTRVILKRLGMSRISGTFDSDKTRWTASSFLDPAARYVVRAAATDSAGLSTRRTVLFRTANLTLDRQTYPTVQPDTGSTVGVAMPVIVKFDLPVTDRANFEKRMSVTSTPRQVGSWYWVSGNEVHWRPRHYWKPGTRVSVNVDVNGARAGNAIFGQRSVRSSFTVGRSIILKANLSTDHLRVYIGGNLARTIPITGGAPGMETRSGIKVIMEKINSLRMVGTSIGISAGSPDFFDIPDVRYAQRLTNSGEFLHSAPWSLYAQGSYNVSHGCMGMSPDNAHYLFQITHIGDPVEVTGSDRPLEPGNGWTDWNVSWHGYQKGSAL
jgi:lipoprotein-anchoring transpeptidase ErfK/SrfK